MNKQQAHALLALIADLYLLCQPPAPEVADPAHSPADTSRTKEV